MQAAIRTCTNRRRPDRQRVVDGEHCPSTIGGYRATKTALDALSANARDWRDNIRVVTVLPGQTNTAFFTNSLGARGGYQPQRADPPEHVAQRIVWGAQREPRTVYMNGGLRMAAFLAGLLPGALERVFARVRR